MDLPPDIRYKKQYLIPGGVIPGPKKPKNFDSYMFPGLAHVNSMQKDGLKVWDALENRVFVSRPFEACGTADGPGLTHFSGLDSKDNWPWVVLVDDAWTLTGKMVELLRQHLPGDITHPPRNPAAKINSSYKSEEFCNYVYGMLPALLYGLLPDDYWMNFCKFVRGVRILLQRKMTFDEIIAAHHSLLAFIIAAHHSLLAFIIEFELLYVQRKPERLHFIRPCLHNLIHIGPDTLRIGPLGLVSQLTMERMIGSLTAEIRQPSNPYGNLSERAARRSQINALMARMDVTPDSGPSGWNPVNIGEGYHLLGPVNSRPRHFRDEEYAVLDFFHLINPSEGVPRVSEYSRLSLPNGQVARSLWREAKRAGPVRITRMVKIIENGVTKYGEVQYYFRYQFSSNEQPVALAMVSLCGPPDRDLLEKSSNVLWACSFKSGDNLAVFPAHCLRSVVAVLPFPKPIRKIQASGDTTDLFILREHLGKSCAIS
ncbi:hypothetical protein EST38_g13377 [Candolleomyces aberdarensis]|uniref:Uncharacterized protein n=1 Tax=Candolleomyces aberdarensis TaxID=2316362 RepID=A0A4V1Q1R2_9AGAR|nr:hypothetical protein EST38_g13377 [Candolleomyces aberdarensis]